MTAVTLTPRLREVLAAVAKPGVHAAVSPQYVARVAGEYPDSTTPAVTSQLIKAGLVCRCYAGSMLMLTPAGVAALTQAGAQ